MDMFQEDNTGEPPITLSYDEAVPYEEQGPVPEPAGSSLAGRIGQTKVYLIADAAAATRSGKVREQLLLQYLAYI